MGSAQTPTALKRWSCSNKQLPAISEIKRIHVYDFDNTLFLSPLPNRQLWCPPAINLLQSQDFMYNGGWWHNNGILSATGEGLEVEEARAWEGSWNENIVELARSSAEDEAALNVLLTGRGEANFTDLLMRMVKAKGLDFDIIALKPAVSPTGKVFANTLDFKYTILQDIVFTYADAEELRMYEDRPKHTKAFRDFFQELNGQLVSTTSTAALPVPRGPIDAEVIQVPEVDSYMNPVREVAEVQRMINSHNQAILDGVAPQGSKPYKLNRQVLFTGYLISPSDSTKLKAYTQTRQKITGPDIKWTANSILISPRPASKVDLSRIGGPDARMRWRVTGFGHHEQRVWALRVTPASSGARIQTESSTPFVVVATKGNNKTMVANRISKWAPAPSNLEFDSVVGEKVVLRIEEERSDEYDFEPAPHNYRQGRKHGRDDDFPPLGTRSNNKPHGQQRGNQSAWSARGSGGIGFAAQRGNGGRGPNQGRGRGRGNERGGGGGGRGRGRGAYRSLDANVGQSYSMSSMEY